MTDLNNFVSFEEPKEEPFDDFIFAPTEKEEPSNESAVIKKEEDGFENFPVENEAIVMMFETCKTAKSAVVEPKEEPVDLSNSSPDHNKNFPMVSRNYAVENSHHEPQLTYDIVNDHDYCLVDWRIEKRYPVVQERHISELKAKNCSSKIKNNTEMECPVCDFRSNYPFSWDYHLQHVHGATCSEMGLYLRCECGSESQSLNYCRRCGSSNSTVVRKSRDEVLGLESKKVTKRHFTVIQKGAQKTVNAQKVHKEVVQKVANVRSESVKKNEDKRDSSGEVPNTMLNRCKKSDRDMKCPECFFETNSVGSWIFHLKRNHSTTPAQAGVALLCECGVECISTSHSITCDIANFTVIQKRPQKAVNVQKVQKAVNVQKVQKAVNVQKVQKIQKVVKTTPQCMWCEVYPRTAEGYVKHLEIIHKSTLRASWIYLKCSCGLEIQSRAIDPKHNKNCDGLQYSLHNVGE